MTATQKLKAIIADKGITYSRISQKTGIPVDSLSKSFLGKRQLRAEELIAICKASDIDLGDLITDTKTA